MTKEKEFIDQDVIRLRDMVSYYLRREDDEDRRENLRFLEAELERGNVISTSGVPAEMVIMNAQVQLHDLDSHERMAYRLVYPEDGGLEDGRLSVLSPLGMAVLGRRAGETIEWAVPDGVRRIKIETVHHQPKPNKD